MDVVHQRSCSVAPDTRVVWLAPQSHDVCAPAHCVFFRQRAFPLQGQFGGIKSHPHLVAQAFSVHTKPFCQRGGIQICSPFVDGILAPNYQIGMQK